MDEILSPVDALMMRRCAALRPMHEGVIVASALTEKMLHCHNYVMVVYWMLYVERVVGLLDTQWNKMHEKGSCCSRRCNVQITKL